MSHSMEMMAAIIFGFALIHTFATSYFQILATRHPKHAGLLHLLGEIEVVFGFWAVILVVLIAVFSGGERAISYVESRQYREPLFVFVIMTVSASRPIIETVQTLIQSLAKQVSIHQTVAQVWLCFTVVPLLGSFITEPAAMTIAALMLMPTVFKRNIPQWLKYAALGVLFVNISIGGTLTSYAAPPVLMVANAWQWNSAFMASTFGWKAALAVMINATLLGYLLRKYLIEMPQKKDSTIEIHPSINTPLLVSLIHIAFLIGVVIFSHHPVIFLGLFLLFLGFSQAYAHYQSPLILKESLLVGFFLAGIVVIGGMQQWWLQPLISDREPLQLFFGALGLTAIMDNASLTFLGSQIAGLSEEAKYMLMAGALSGGGLTIIANAPNLTGVALLKQGFNNGSIGIAPLLLGALPPTIIAAILFLF